MTLLLCIGFFDFNGYRTAISGTDVSLTDFPCGGVLSFCLLRYCTCSRFLFCQRFVRLFRWYHISFDFGGSPIV